jgi:hypothetical protein
MPDAAQTTAPSTDELEVSLFGPGVGECVVMHLGNGDWIVVDSCGARRDEPPIALKYLSSLGVDISSAVRLVVVTHWHDDHIRGIAEIFRKAISAQLVCSAAVDVEDFYRIVRELSGTGAGTDEFAGLFNELVQRLPTNTRDAAATPVWALSGRPLLRVPLGEAKPRAEVIALSPSDVALALAHVRLGEELEKHRSSPLTRRLVDQSPNEAAIALWIRAGAFDVLLGSDLEESSNPRDGWHAVVADHAAAGRPRAQLFKVAHHGSNNADSADVWDSMLVPGAHAGLTPFRRQKLPRKADLERLGGRTKELFVTADPEGRKPPRRDPAVDRTLREVAKARSVQAGRMGHVRFRAPLAGGSFNVTLFDGAYRAS